MVGQLSKPYLPRPISGENFDAYWLQQGTNNSPRLDALILLTRATCGFMLA
jgi:hypothetical protein